MLTSFANTPAEQAQQTLDHAFTYLIKQFFPESVRYYRSTPAQNAALNILTDATVGVSW